MGVHGKTVVGKTSTLNSLSINEKKKITTAENSNNLKIISRKSSSSSTAAGTRTNASASVDAANMAPALTEPLSPTEKLSSSTEASVSPTVTAISTEGEEIKLENLAVAGAAASATSSTRASPASHTNLREKRNTTRSVTSSARVTRSKDTIGIERNLTPSAVRESPTTPTIGIRKSKRNSKENDNEQMGLSVVTPSTTTPTSIPTTTTAIETVTETSTATTTSTTECTDLKTIDDDKTSSSSNNNNNNNIVCKDNSTAQLLADLTTDFEETITAEICLRKKLPEVKVTTPDAAQLSASSETESETTASKITSGETSENSEVAKSPKSLHMETAAVENASGSGSSKTDEIQTIETLTELKKQEEKVEQPKNLDDVKDSEVVATNLPAVATAAAAGSLELPPVNSDSTMTASEEEPEELDALEAKLSQLDGSAAETTAIAAVENAADASGDADVTMTPITFATTMVNSTPPRTPIQQQTASTPTQQLLLTPTPSTSQMLALTPQSTSLLMREVNAAVTGGVGVGVGGGGGGGGGELEDQELEEVLKALKGFDANSAGADLDLNVLLNEVYTTFSVDELAGTNSSGVNSSHIINQQHQTNLITSSSNLSTTTIAKIATSPLKELHADIEKKQQIMQRKIDFILRRLRKLQVRYMSKHTTEEIAGLFELTARLTNKGTNNAATSKDLLAASVISARPPPRSWDEDLKNPISPTDMVNLLSRLEKSANAQQICTTSSSSSTSLTMSNSSFSPSYSTPTISVAQQMRKSKKTGEITSSTSTSSTTGTPSSSCTTIQAMEVDGHKNDETVVPIFNPQIVDELTHVTGMLRAEMRDIQLAYDSDATESSSGGESADEMVTYNNQVQQSLSIVKRAAWRYSRERAAIASRWSWLLSQIADLEIKIRQHSELFQEVVRTKGAVVCEEELAKAATTREPLINAYGENEEIILSGACRTRGFVPTQFRKRKMLQTTSLHTISKKAARPSTIKCGCQYPLKPCALCTGRIDPTAPRDLPDTMMFPERVALLDPGFHPVLSFTENVSNSIHFEAIAKTSNWQNRIVRIQPKSVVRSVWKAEREAASLSSHHSSRKYGEILMPTQKRRYIRRKDRNATTSAATNVQQQQTTGVSNNNIDVNAANNNKNSTEFAMPSSMGGAATPTPPTMHQQQQHTLTPASTSGNGTATLFSSTTSTTTPLVANKIKNNMKMHCLQVGDGVLLEPHSPNINSSNNQMNDYQTPQNSDQYNPSQTPSSLISNSHNQQQLQNSNNTNNNKRRHYKQRKSVVSLNQQFNNNNISNNSHNLYSNNNNNNHSNHTQQQHNYNNTQQQQNYQSNGDINIDYWDTIGGGRSRTASPTHTIGGSSSNYHKYERSLERRNRISYDIDNIVIPYSVAAATRVEILPYKEIPTPKWRVFDDELTFDSDQEETKSQTTTSITKLENSNEIQDSKNIITINNKNEKLEEEKRNSDEEKFAKPIEPKSLITSLKAQICDKSNENNVENLASKNADHEPPPSKKVKVETLKTDDDTTVTTTITNNISKISFSNQEKTFKLQDNLNDNCNENNNRKDQEDLDDSTATDLEEDISDETLFLRHERALNEERRKFQTYLKFPWSTRSRANRRIDSRAESSGANTPDPASPAPNTPSLGGGDQESIPSPLAPSTPLTPLDAVNETTETGSATVSSAHSSTANAPPAFPVSVAAMLNNYSNNGSKRNERRRTTSTKIQSTDRSERRSLTPDSKEVPNFTIPPFEPLKFPLSDEQYEVLSSVTFLPPSISSFYGDADLKQQDDYQHCISSNNLTVSGVSSNLISGHLKTITPRNGRRTTSTSKLTAATTTTAGNYDVNGKRRRPYRRQQNIIDAEHKVADSNDELSTSLLPYTNGQLNTDLKNIENNYSTTAMPITANSTDIELEDVDDDDDDDEFYDELADDDDDGYPKHCLAPGIDIDNLIDDDEYDPYSGVGGSSGGGNVSGIGSGNNSKNHHHLAFSDSEFSEPDPFEDDDPNDPEWKGETSAKSERHSERLRKRS